MIGLRSEGGEDWNRGEDGDDDEQVEDPDDWQTALGRRKKSTFAVKQSQVLFSRCSNKNSDDDVALRSFSHHFFDVRFARLCFHVYIHTSCNVANYCSHCIVRQERKRLPSRFKRSTS